jgi:hypothetical protein
MFLVPLLYYSTMLLVYSHIHIYTDKVEDLSVYKSLEKQLNEFGNKAAAILKDDSDSASIVSKKRDLWKSIIGGDDHFPTAFTSHNQDVVQQLMMGFGFRVTGARYPSSLSSSQDGRIIQTNTRSVLVTSSDPTGAKFIVTAIDDASNFSADSKKQIAAVHDNMHHFDAQRVQDYFHAHNNRQGIAVLAFDVDDLPSILDRYMKLHPKLVADHSVYYHDTNGDNNIKSSKTATATTHVLEVYAYYQQHNNGSDQELLAPDTGTILRFIQVTGGDDVNSRRQSNFSPPLPGLIPVAAEFDESSMSAYSVRDHENNIHHVFAKKNQNCGHYDSHTDLIVVYSLMQDHWVSNVHSRTEFLDILHDTLFFKPKVDFNAGVVAAGEAQIESSVTGNDADVLSLTDDKARALRDQSQIYLPINNALSNVGHVHGYLQEIGQGVQHVASRVSNLVDFVQRANDNRKITNQGFSFLNIPRSYYGVLTAEQLMQGILGDGSDSVSKECAHEIMEVLWSGVSESAGGSLLSKEGALDLDCSRKDLDGAIEKGLLHGDHTAALEEYRQRRDGVLSVILRSRYRNLYSLLQDNIPACKYVSIVRNQILVDIQGDDLLYQIFTANILQRQPGEEAPFFEFIERVCSESKDVNGRARKFRPGCGGFGIRNFLTLFLSIEVSKAMQQVADAKKTGDMELQRYAQSMVDCFTDQLTESNPVLTKLSDAMTDEGHYKEKLEATMARAADANGSLSKETSMWKTKMAEAAERKRQGNLSLMACSARYNQRMAAIRQSQTTAAKPSAVIK